MSQGQFAFKCPVYTQDTWMNIVVEFKIWL